MTPEIEVSQRWALRQHSCKPLCHCCSNPIEAEIKVNQCWALRQHLCKPLCILSGGRHRELPHHELKLLSGEFRASSEKLLLKNLLLARSSCSSGQRQAQLVHCIFDSRRGPSQHDSPASCPNPALILQVRPPELQ
jgi:hypothetical protein